jgi:hypothetical protein
MPLGNKVRRLVTLSIILVLATIAQTSAKDSDKKKRSYKGTPVMWAEPADIASRDLYYGPGGKEMMPALGRVTFIEEEKGGYSTKYRVRDGRGRIWVAKIGKEAQTDTVANRLFWAVGYETEISYLVPRVNIQGKGTFENVRFEARPAHIKRVGEWEWDENPFIGTRPFQGLKVMMVLINNWDIKDSNNRVLFARDSRTGRNELRYIVSDLGATFGKTGSFLTRSRNNPDDYVEAEFIDELKGRKVDFHYSGKRKSVFRNISIEEARWMGGWLSRLSARQIKDAFRAANYSPEEVQMLAEALQIRIGELMMLPRG